MTTSEIPVQHAAPPDTQQGATRDHLIGAHGWTILDIAVSGESLDLLHQFEHFEASVGLVEVNHDH